MNKSFFFNADTSSGSADITYSAADLAAEKAAYFSDGVLAPDDFKVSAVDSLTVKIAPGGAVLGGYTYVNSSIGVRAISSAAATKARRDLCVLKLDLSIRAMTVVIKSGMPSDDPQLSRYLAGDVLPSPLRGWTLVRADGVSLGWAKGDGTQLKNHYPKARRRPV